MSESQILNLAMSSLSLMVSLALLIVHLKNRKTQFSSYALARSAHRSSSIDLIFVSAEQLNDSVLMKLALFNPGSIAAIIKSLTVYREIKSTAFFGRIFSSVELQEVTEARWWPTADSSSKTPKTLADEYESLYVENYRDILVSMPGCIDRNVYRFVIQTNHGGYEIPSTIDITKSHFPHAFRRWFYER